MKQLAALSLLMILALTACATTPSNAPTRHRVILEATAASPEQWEGILRNVVNLRASFAPEPMEIEVVVHGGALGMLKKTNEAQRDQIAQLAAEGIVFAACEKAMRRNGVTADQLFPFAKTVDAAVAEIVRKQEAGWAYVRTAG